MKILVTVNTLSSSRTYKEYEIFELKDKYEKVDLELTTYRIWKQIYDRYPGVNFELIENKVRELVWGQETHFTTTSAGSDWRRRNDLRNSLDFNTEYKDFSLTILKNDGIHVYQVVTQKILDHYKSLKDPISVKYKNQYEIYVQCADGIFHIKHEERYQPLKIDDLNEISEEERMKIFFRKTDPITFESANDLVRKHTDVLVIGKDYQIKSEPCFNPYTYHPEVFGEIKSYKDLNGVEYVLLEGINDCICAPRSEIFSKMILA